MSVERLSTEIRYAIYDYLFADLQALTIEMWQTGNQRDGSWSCANKLFEGLLRAPYVGTASRDQIMLARNLMLTCRRVRYDVAGILYSKLIPRLTRTTDDILQFNLRLASFVKPCLRRIWTKASYKSAKDREVLSRTVATFSGLQDIIFTNCDASAKSWAKGTDFKPDVLRMLKAIQKTCPHLQHAYYQIPAAARSNMANVVLTSRDPGKDGLIKWDVDAEYHERDRAFDVEVEYELWLLATRGKGKLKMCIADDIGH